MNRSETGLPRVQSDDGPILDVNDLKVHFPLKKGLFRKTADKVYAVDGISFHLARGETLGIVGESGCGKTTAGLAVLRLIKPTSGQVFFEGRDMAALNQRQWRRLTRRMQIIFQDPYSSLNPRMTVNEILANPMDIHGIHTGKQRRERLAYLLEKVGLTPEQGTRYPHEFSGGQRQRVGIARALSLDPVLVIGDEPVSALDVSIQAQIINLLIDLQREFGLSYVIIAHDLAVVEYICDRIAVMYLGKVVETGSYKSLYNNPKHPYTQALLSACPVPDPQRRVERQVLVGDVPSPIHPPEGCHFHPRCPKCMDGCSRERPGLIEVEPGHFAACFLYG